ncbi:hypothetical protein GWK47_024417 [Chionoecetes opilio]|uniref:Uncharacterized protein n=1 Tax=Chionoecetes opilio TaxID=41210 RepID=A0A8J5CJ90_CHIOP|nr:hypothetical protein GWK47_024417 [Chionoecetes opilio]
MELNDLSSMNNVLMINNDILTLADYGMGLNDSWGNLEGQFVENPAQEPSPVVVPQPQPQPQAPAGPRDGSVSTSFIPDSPPNSQVPSIQNWPGQYDFQISVPVGNKDRNKVRKRSGPAVTSTSEKKKRFTIKLEPGTDRRYQNVPVSIEAFFRNLNVTFFYFNFIGLIIALINIYLFIFYNQS